MDFSSGKNFIAPVSQATQHTLFEVLLLIIVSGLFYWFIVSPKVQSNAVLQTKLDEVTQENNQVSENKRKLESAIRDMETHPNEIAYLDEALPLDNRVTKLHIALASLTANSGMTVGDINIAGGGEHAIAGNIDVLAAPFKAKRTLQKLNASLSVTGTFDQFQGLLEKLETSGRLLNVTNISITNSKDSLLDFRLNLESYFYE